MDKIESLTDKRGSFPINHEILIRYFSWFSTWLRFNSQRVSYSLLLFVECFLFSSWYQLNKPIKIVGRFEFDTFDLVKFWIWIRPNCWNLGWLLRVITHLSQSKLNFFSRAEFGPHEETPTQEAPWSLTQNKTSRLPNKITSSNI